jgi:hypothetical protein
MQKCVTVHQTGEALMFVLLIAFAAAGSQAGPVDPATVAATPVKEKMVCRHVEETGTRIGRHTRCQTASEWQRDKAEAESAISDIQKQDIIRPDPYAIPVSKPQ